MNDQIGLILMSIGLFFNIIGCLCLVRFPDLYSRLQGATKCVMLGTIFILAGVAVYIGWGQTALKAVMCILFLLFTMPTIVHEISRGAHIYGIELCKESITDKYESEVDGKLHWGKD